MYSEEQVYDVLTRIGVHIVQDTMTDYIGYCPFHGNTDTPSFAVNKVTGTFLCFNPSCDMRGGFKHLIRSVTKKDDTAIEILLAQSRRGGGSFKTVKHALKRKEFTPFAKPAMIERLADEMWGEDSRGRDYMHFRGFDDETLKHFGIGYSAKKNMIVTPMHDPKGILVGFIGRSADKDNKTFKNSPNLPTSMTLWNLHRAKKHGAKLIINESNFDTMRIHQAGFPHVAGTLGGYWNETRAELVDKYFTSIVIMTDDDKMRYQTPCRKCLSNGHKACVGHLDGEALGLKIAETLPQKRISWAMVSDITNAYNKRLYDKDACGMTDRQIRDCIENAVPHIEYVRGAHTLLAS